MGHYQLKAMILLFLENNNVNFMNELKHKLREQGCYDMLVLLDEDREFSDRIKNYLFKKRLGVLSHV